MENISYSMLWLNLLSLSNWNQNGAQMKSRETFTWLTKAWTWEDSSLSSCSVLWKWWWGLHQNDKFSRFSFVNIMIILKDVVWKHEQHISKGLGLLRFGPLVLWRTNIKLSTNICKKWRSCILLFKNFLKQDNLWS
jgi:hypothetical protein